MKNLAIFFAAVVVILTVPAASQAGGRDRVRVQVGVNTGPADGFYLGFGYESTPRRDRYADDYYYNNYYNDYYYNDYYYNGYDRGYYGDYGRNRDKDWRKWERDRAKYERKAFKEDMKARRKWEKERAKAERKAWKRGWR